MEDDKRKNLRYEFVYPIKYVLHTEAYKEILKGIITDISHSGVGLYTSSPLKEGQEITIYSILPAYSSRAVVRWTKHLENGSYKTGLEFE